MLKDLDSLIHDVVDHRTRPLVAEAIKAYDAGALRSATVSLWIAVVADLTLKLRHLAESGDGTAKEALSKLDKALEKGEVKQVQEYERNLLKLAGSQLELLSKREATEMQRLNGDRNRCAHPGFEAEDSLFMPDAELVRAHLVAATRAVFSQQPLSGKRLLATLDDELYGNAWPGKTHEGLAQYLMSRYFQKTRESVKTSLLKVLVKGSIQPKDGQPDNALRCGDAARAMLNEMPGKCQGALADVLSSWEGTGKLSEEYLVRAVGAFGGTAVFWDVLPATARDRLDSLLDNLDIAYLVEHGFFVSGEVSDEHFAPRFTDLASKLDTAQLSAVLITAKHMKVYIPRILEIITSSSSFRGAEENLRILESVAHELTADDISDLEQAIRDNPKRHRGPYNQVSKAGGTESILISMYESRPVSAEHQAAWRSLAAFLREETNGDQYDALCQRVGVPGPAESD